MAERPEHLLTNSLPAHPPYHEAIELSESCKTYWWCAAHFVDPCCSRRFEETSSTKKNLLHMRPCTAPVRFAGRCFLTTSRIKLLVSSGVMFELLITVAPNAIINGSAAR